MSFQCEDAQLANCKTTSTTYVSQVVIALPDFRSSLQDLKPNLQLRYFLHRQHADEMGHTHTVKKFNDVPVMNIHQLIILMKIKTHSNKAKTLSFFAFNSGSIEYSCILTNYFYRGHSVTVQTVKAEIIEKKHQACSKRRESNPLSPNYLVRGLPLCFSFLSERMYFLQDVIRKLLPFFSLGPQQSMLH